MKSEYRALTPVTITPKSDYDVFSMISRNDPCPCGSGKKYKKCHLGQPDDPAAPPPPEPTLADAHEQSASTSPAGGLDPSQFNPEMMASFMQMFQRLPKGQVQRFQAIMQKAMAGKDVSREAAEFEKTLPVEFQSLIQGMSQQIPEGALQQAEEKLQKKENDDPSAPKSKLGKFWKSMTSRKKADA